MCCRPKGRVLSRPYLPIRPMTVRRWQIWRRSLHSTASRLRGRLLSPSPSLAPALVKSMKIQDVKQLAEAKEIAYKEGFYNGVMLVGEFKGMNVEEAKPKVRERMIEAGLAMAYAETEGLIISRSTDECVVALMDQWYLDYGEAGWHAETERLLKGIELYQPETRHSFEKTLAWLNQWACARTYGLGSQLPWDPQFLVESLSDLTIYMSYYTVAQLLHEQHRWSKPGPLGITPDQMSDEIWEYVFCDGPFPSPSPLPQEKADALKQLLLPHGHPLVRQRPGSQSLDVLMRTNGHLLLNGKKMSKSTGNSLNLKEAIAKFGADSTRLSLADAGDGVEDVNFDKKSVNANILRVHTSEMVQDEPNLRHGPKNLYHDLVFEQEINDLINVTQLHYEATNYEDALKYGFYELQTSCDWYHEVTSDVGMHADLVMYWIRVAALVVSPIAPHFSEHICSTVLKSPTSIQRALWPTPSAPVDVTVVESGVYTRGTKTIRDVETTLVMMLSKAKGKGAKDGKPMYDLKKPKSVRLYIAMKFPEGQERQVDDPKVRALLTGRGLIKDKRTMPFVHDFKKRMAQFDIEVYSIEDALAKQGEDGFTKNIIELSEPGSPAIEYHGLMEIALDCPQHDLLQPRGIKFPHPRKYCGNVAEMMRKYKISAEFPCRGNVAEMLRKLNISAARKYCGNDGLHPTPPRSKEKVYRLIKPIDKPGTTEKILEELWKTRTNTEFGDLV
ncbi:hypothetical protein K438DRAFT_1947775 [Mycena galopus ATCC 62051]|nr:hypothetical protein K438DRAFT_1947775 [Mycena galopus ATCC 62051]